MFDNYALMNCLASISPENPEGRKIENREKSNAGPMEKFLDSGSNWLRQRDRRIFYGGSASFRC